MALQAAPGLVQWAIYGLALARMLTAILVLVQHYRGTLLAGMQRLAIASLLLMGVLFYSRQLFTGIEIGMRPPGAGRPSVAMNREAYAFMGFPSVLREADAVASGILGLIGGFLTVRAAGRQPDTL